MNEERSCICIECYSEKTHDFIGCGVVAQQFSDNEFVIGDIEKSDIEESLEESFWELLSSFESSAQESFDNGEIAGTDFDELFKVFGHFHFSCTVDEKPIYVDFGIDPDKFMYPRLVEYLEINAE